MNRNILALDFGSERITAVLAAVDEETGTLRLRHAVRQPCASVNACFLRDMKDVSETLNKLFADISEYVSFNPSVVIGLRGNFLSFKRSSGFASIEGRNRCVSAKDIQNALNDTVPASLSDMLDVVDILPLAYTIDGNHGITHPLGFPGCNLEAEAFVSCAMVTHLDALNKVLAECECNEYQVMPSCVALAETLLKTEEKKAGVLLLDIGADHSSAVLYHKGFPVDAWELEGGTNHIARELAEVLQNDFADARKELDAYTPGDDDVIDDVLEEAARQLFKSLYKELTHQFNFVKYLPSQVVLCGGGADDTRLKACKSVFGVRKARVAGHEDLIADFEKADGGAYTTAISLILHTLEREGTQTAPAAQPKAEGFWSGIFNTLGLNELI